MNTQKNDLLSAHEENHALIVNNIGSQTSAEENFSTQSWAEKEISHIKGSEMKTIIGKHRGFIQLDDASYNTLLILRKAPRSRLNRRFLTTLGKPLFISKTLPMRNFVST